MPRMVTTMEILSELGSIADVIRDQRPPAVELDGREIGVEYSADAETGVEYAFIHVWLPEGWQVESDIGTHEALGLVLYLDE